MDTIALGQRAKALLDDPTFQTVLDVMQADYIANWAASPAGDGEGREALWLMYRTIEGIKAELAKFAEVPVVAAAKAEQEKQDRIFDERQGYAQGPDSQANIGVKWR